MEEDKYLFNLELCLNTIFNMINFKPKFIVIFLFVLSCNIPFGPDFYPDLSYLYVTSPGEGNNWDIGSNQSISWSVQNVSFTSVKMELYQNDTLIHNIDDEININGQSSNNNSDQTANSNSNQTADSSLVQGAYDWLLLYQYDEGNNYTVRITAEQKASDVDTLVYAESEKFNLSCNTCPIYFQIISPKGGEILKIGEKQTIEWRTNNEAISPDDKIKIDLYKGSNLVMSIMNNINNSGTYPNWTPHSDNVEQSTNYKIRITSTSDSTKFSESYNSFALKEDSF